jgi:hypothetical protein
LMADRMVLYNHTLISMRVMTVTPQCYYIH